MTYLTDNSIDFNAVAREVISARQTGAVSTIAGRGDGTELVPTEVNARIRREKGEFLRPAVAGATVDQEGLANNYALEPNMYLAVYPSPEQQRSYLFQGAAAFLLVALTLVTAVAVS
jgi:hypothetical protein